MSDYRPLLEQFALAIERRSSAEQALRDEFGHGPDEHERELHARLADVQAAREAELDGLCSKHQLDQQELDDRYGGELGSMAQHHRAALHEIESQAAVELAQLEQQKEDSAWVVTSVLDDTAEDSPKREYERFKAQIHKLREEQIAEWTDLDGAFKEMVALRNWSGPPPIEPEQAPRKRDEAQQWFFESVERSRHRLQSLRSLWLPKLFRGLRSLILFAVLAVLIAIPFFMFVQPESIGVAADRLSSSWVAASGGAGAVGSLLLTLIIYTLASMQESDAFRQLQQSTAETGWLHQRWLGMAREDLEAKQQECDRRQKRMVREREEQLRRFEQAHQRKRQEIEDRRDHAHRDEVQRFNQERTQTEHACNSAKANIQHTFDERRREIEERTRLEVQAAEQALATYTRERQRKQLEQWSRMKSSWETACDAFQSKSNEVNTQSEQAFRPWEELRTQWTPAATIPELLRFGHYDVDLNMWPAAISDDMRLAPRVTQHELPATLPFPEQSSILFKTPGGAGRDEAVAAMRSLTLRLLTLLPPGKLRFTILDPIGLGESFAGLMHLTDFDELMVSSRIWTEPGQIENKLADLTEHMENVLQKYLRNEFQTIEEYNAAAGEVAEPYH
ncbi:MAG: hypothetical protein KDA58_03525, partial [Planctomycetaceae bacterium]|nr:hypothetical protein [Planctomycetaceae bacterium]